MKTTAFLTPAKKCKAGIALFGTTAVLTAGLAGMTPALADDAANSSVEVSPAAQTPAATPSPDSTQPTQAPNAEATPSAETTPAPAETSVPTPAPSASEEPVVGAAAALADQYTPSWANGTVAPGQSVTVAYTGDQVDVPAVALADLPDTWLGKFETETRGFTFVAPADAQSGQQVTIPVLVTYEDGSTDTTSIVITIKGQPIAENELYSPSWESGTIKPGETITLKYTGDEILTEATAKGELPEGWTVTRAPESRDFIVTAPANAQNGYVLNAPITITYGDGTVDTATINVTVVAEVVTPAHVQPAPAEPAPVQPEPAQPAPAEPAAAVAEKPAPAATQAPVASAQEEQPALAKTGATSISVLTGAGLLLLAAGAVLVWSRRRFS